MDVESLSSPDPSAGATIPYVEVIDLQRRYEGVLAVDGVSLAVQRGTVHALVGENGAGKSTIGKIIAGVVRPSGGELRFNGLPVSFSGPRDALAAGVALVHQEMALAPSLSVEDNIFLGGEVSRWFTLRRRETRAQVTRLMEETGLILDPSTPVGGLRVAEQQIVEILRAIARGADLIVMDEPTAALSATEVDRLKAVVRGLRQQGKTIIYISHQLEEVLELADTVSVIKDGKLVLTRATEGATPDQLITAMLGRPLSSAFPGKRPPAASASVVLDVCGLCRRGALENISFTIAAGEIVGFAGLVGCGRSELARAIFGADPIHSGSISLEGRAVRFRSPVDAVRSGVAFLPEDRKGHGLVMNLGVRQNLTLSALGSFTRAGVIDRKREQSGALELVDEPTRGVDVGAKRAIYDLICTLADQGMAVMLISSDLIEVQGLAHRIVVMRGGRVAANLDGGATESDILSAAFGRPETTKES